MGTVKLKDGRIVCITLFQLDDKEKPGEMYALLSAEAVCWAMQPYTREVIERWLANVANLVPLVATCNDRIVGHAQILKYPHPQRKGTSDLIIYPHQDFHNTGLDLAMLTKLVELAKKEGLHRIGLQVVADNKCAVYLYEKLGFKI